MPKPVRSLRDEQKAMTQRRLLQAARTLFETKGYSATSAEDIANEAGASRATFYLHYPSKVAILAEVFQDAHVTPVLELIKDLGSVDELTYESLRSWVDAYANTYRRTKMVMRAWLQGESREGGELRQVYDRVLNDLLETLSQQVVVARGGDNPITAEDARLRALLMFHELERFCYLHFIRRVTPARERGLDLITQSWLALIDAD